MPTVCETPRAWSASSAAALDPEWMWVPTAYGPAGQELAREIDKALRHFHDLTPDMPALASFSAGSRLDEDEVDLEYHPMPPKRAFEFAATVTVTGRGRPTRYVLPEDDLD